MYINNTWDPHLFSLILRDYLQIHPLTTDELKVLLAELKAPHLFLNIASKYYLNRKPKWSKELFNSILTKTLRLEYEKLEVLKKFLAINLIGRTCAGNFPSNSQLVSSENIM